MQQSVENWILNKSQKDSIVWGGNGKLQVIDEWINDREIICHAYIDIGGERERAEDGNLTQSRPLWPLNETSSSC